MQICSPELYLSGEPSLDNLQESWKNAIFRHLGRGNGRGQGRKFLKIVQRCSVGPYLSIEPSFNMFQNFFVVIRFCLGNTFGLTLDLKKIWKFLFVFRNIRLWYPVMLQKELSFYRNCYSRKIWTDAQTHTQTHTQTHRRTSCNYNIDEVITMSMKVR